MVPSIDHATAVAGAGARGVLEVDPEDLAGPVEGGVHDLLGPVLTGALTSEGTPGRPPSFSSADEHRFTQILLLVCKFVGPRSGV